MFQNENKYDKKEFYQNQYVSNTDTPNALFSQNTIPITS